MDSPVIGTEGEEHGFQLARRRNHLHTNLKVQNNENQTNRARNWTENLDFARFARFAVASGETPVRRNNGNDGRRRDTVSGKTIKCGLWIFGEADEKNGKLGWHVKCGQSAAWHHRA